MKSQILPLTVFLFLLFIFLRQQFKTKTKKSNELNEIKQIKHQRIPASIFIQHFIISFHQFTHFYNRAAEYFK